MNWKLGALIIIMAGLIVGCSKGRENCPTKTEAAEAIKKVLPVQFDVVDVRMSEIPALCEVVIMVGKDPVVAYMDKNGKYVLSGSIVETATKKNITAETQKKFAPEPPKKAVPKKK